MNIRIAAAVTGATLSLATIAGVAAASSGAPPAASTGVGTFDAQERITLCEILEEAGLYDEPDMEELLAFLGCDTGEEAPSSSEQAAD
ncbi:hypothetical protein [Saccharothrix longispora]|uniref:hypothetical protein n=1 Tax=Saccharothrix longispora TaxID=33920 RepID=UPI0028FDB346|nr:hypothetical protein [Saccharothrix longispora]MBY8849342.1 hypothetical protein [Saccharothrix sp. MB29]MDU0292706.1 hypothetical protein [Saccharothrix longispora]